MAERVAVVTGGTRGIGAAISRMLKDRGYKVAATYAGNDVAAQQFKEETGIAVYKFDVGDFDACQSGRRADREGSRAGRDRWSTMPASPATPPCAGSTRDMWDAVIDTNLGSCFNMSARRCGTA